MKRHGVYKWFRNVVLLGIPALFASCFGTMERKYGPPVNMRVIDTAIEKENQDKKSVSDIQIDEVINQSPSEEDNTNN